MEEKKLSDEWREEIAALKGKAESLKNEDDVIVLYGSSTFRLWVTMAEDLLPLNSANFGFGGSTYRDCLYYFDEVFTTIKPRMFILYGGDNDLANGHFPEEILHNLNQILERITSSFPEAEVAVIGIKPSPSKANMLEEIKAMNELISERVMSFGGLYINVYNAMLDRSENAASDLFESDGLHMNEAGYAIWSKAIKDQLT